MRPPCAGPKSAEKVKAILEEGFLQRNVWQQDDAAEKAFAAFCKLWGIGPKRAQKWVTKGLRTVEAVLQDSEEMASLGVRERAGVLNAEDLAQRIPRRVRYLCSSGTAGERRRGAATTLNAEDDVHVAHRLLDHQRPGTSSVRVQEVLAGGRIVTDAIIRALQRLCGCTRAAAADRLHSRPLGSFGRGRADAGDLDMMVIPPDALPWVCPKRISSVVVADLHAQGFVTDDVPLHEHPEACDCPRDTNSTWLGLCYVPGAPPACC